MRSPARTIGSVVADTESVESEVNGVERRWASKFARMEITRPEVMRATRAHQAFRRFAGALRPTGEDFYHKSFVSKKISSFWSHSWHGNHIMKIVTLLVLHNGPASIAVGSFTAFATTILFCLGILPGWVRSSNEEHIHYSNWAMGSAFLATSMTFLLWRSQRLVFLDRICINQHDDDLKRQSIYSLGGIIGQAQEMLVLWDSSWSDRLWCQYEFSAFLRKRSDKQTLVIRPTFLGPSSCAVFLGFSLLTVPSRLPNEDLRVPLLCALLLGLLACYSVVSALRGYFRMVETLKDKMRSFSFDKSRSACCDIDHSVEGRRIVCDRQIVKECVSIWFGDQEAFEDYVRSKVAANLTTQLESQVFTRWWSLGVAMPFLWAPLDNASAYAAAGEYDNASARFITGSVVWILCSVLIDYLMYLTWRFSQKPTWTACEIMKNLALVLCVMVFLSAITASLVWSVHFPWGSQLQRAGVFAAFWCFVVVGHLLMKFILSRKTR